MQRPIERRLSDEPIEATREEPEHGPIQEPAKPAVPSRRVLGNVQAASKGPTAYAKRAVRRKVYRRTSTATGRALRAFGLQGKRRR